MKFGMRYAVVFLVCLFSTFHLSAQTPVKKKERSGFVPITSGIVDQRDFADSVNGCGPASILNMLKFSREDYLNSYLSVLGSDEGVKMRFLVDRYFKNRKSVTFPAAKRWMPSGIQSADLVTGLNEFLKDEGIPELSGTYLDLKKGETERNHIVRCHDLISASIRSGVMPILSLRSYIVKRRESNDLEPRWETAVHHYVVVTSVTRPPSETGFEVAVLEPWRGKKTTIYIHREANGQAFRALKGVEENGQWLGGTPFLQVIGHDLPTMRPKGREWSDRFIIVANFLIGEF